MFPAVPALKRSCLIHHGCATAEAISRQSIVAASPAEQCGTAQAIARERILEALNG
jgi:hypothetical protein